MSDMPPVTQGTIAIAHASVKDAEAALDAFRQIDPCPDPDLSVDVSAEDDGVTLGFSGAVPLRWAANLVVWLDAPVGIAGMHGARATLTCGEDSLSVVPNADNRFGDTVWLQAPGAPAREYNVAFGDWESRTASSDAGAEAPLSLASRLLALAAASAVAVALVLLLESSR